MTGSFPLTIETPDSIAMQVLNALFYGLPLDQLQTFRERVNAVDVDDIERVARVYLKPDAVSVVLVGNASVFARQLRGVGFGRYETIPLEDLDLLATDFKERQAVAGRRLRSSALADTAPRPPTVGDAAGARRGCSQESCAAKGRPGALSVGIKTITAVTAATMRTPAGKLDTKTTTYLAVSEPGARRDDRLPQGLADPGLRRDARLGA